MYKVKKGKVMEGAYLGDLRQRILRALDRGLPVREISAFFEVSTSFIYKALIRRRTTGEIGARGCRIVKKLVGYRGALLKQVRLQLRITELQGWLLKALASQAA